MLSGFKLGRLRYNGVWFLDQESAEYTFIPGRWDFRSPYGGAYPVKFVGR
jgi:hypothetical protein